MTFSYFSTAGYLSILLWLVVPVLWTVHAVRRPRRWLCHLAVVVALVSLVLATINSKTYVNRIQIDRSEELAAAQERQEAARRAAEEARSDDVAKVRFAEDDADDFLDDGGMDDADRKYMASFDDDATPDWKKEKRTRSRTREKDTSLDAMLDVTTEGEKGVDIDVVEEEAAEPIMMPERHVMLANRLDGLNLKWIRALLLATVGVVLLDYLRRSNTYDDAYLPLPLPGSLVRAFAPMPAVYARSESPRRGMPEELKWLARRGDAFLYLTDDASKAASVPQQMPRFALGLRPTDVLHVDQEGALLDDTFIFEGLWYNRASFVVADPVRAERLLGLFAERLRDRKATRATVDQTVHLVWDLSTPIPETLRAELVPLVGATGWSLWDDGA